MHPLCVVWHAVTD